MEFSFFEDIGKKGMDKKAQSQIRRPVFLGGSGRALKAGAFCLLAGLLLGLSAVWRGGFWQAERGPAMPSQRQGGHLAIDEYLGDAKALDLPAQRLAQEALAGERASPAVSRCGGRGRLKHILASRGCARRPDAKAARDQGAAKAGILKELKEIFAGSRQIREPLYAAFAQKLKPLKTKNPALYQKAAEELKKAAAPSRPPWVRTAAYLMAGDLGDPEFLPLMRERLEAGIEEAIARPPRDPHSLEHGLEPPFVRAAIIQGASRMGELALPILELGAKDPHYYARGQVMFAAPGIGPPAFPLLLAGMEDPENYVFALALDGIEKAARSESGAARARLQTAAINKAPGLTEERGLEVLERFHRDSLPETRALAADTAKKIKGGMEILKKMENDADKSVRMRIAYSAAESGDPEGLELLKRYADHEDSEMRAHAARALAGLKPQLRRRGYDLLEHIEKTGDSEARKAVVITAFELAESAPARARAILERLKNSSSREVSALAAARLKDL